MDNDADVKMTLLHMMSLRISRLAELQEVLALQCMGDDSDAEDAVVTLKFIAAHASDVEEWAVKLRDMIAKEGT